MKAAGHRFCFSLVLLAVFGCDGASKEDLVQQINAKLPMDSVLRIDSSIDGTSGISINWPCHAALSSELAGELNDLANSVSWANADLRGCKDPVSVARVSNQLKSFTISIKGFQFEGPSLRTDGAKESPTDEFLKLSNQVIRLSRGKADAAGLTAFLEKARAGTILVHASTFDLQERCSVQSDAKLILHGVAVEGEGDLLIPLCNSLQLDSMVFNSKWRRTLASMPIDAVLDASSVELEENDLVRNLNGVVKFETSPDTLDRFREIDNLLSGSSD